MVHFKSSNYDYKPHMANAQYSNHRRESMEATQARISALKKSNKTLYKADQKIDEDQAFEDISEAARKFVATGSYAEQKVLADVLEENNLLLYCYDYTETSQDKRDVARMAFGGYVDRPREDKLSTSFRRLKNLQIPRKNAAVEEYNLDNSTTWQVFKQVPEFAAIEEQLKSELSSFGVPPEMLPELNVQDFCFLINEKFRSNNKESAKVFPESYKSKHTKRFISENEAEFREGLMSLPGIQADYVETLIRAMKKGVTNLSEYKENGKPVWKESWKDQPVIDVHHIVNIKDASTKENMGKSFADVNAYENMCFIVRHPQHDAMHALENDLAHNTHRDDVFYNRKIGKKFIFRIQPPEGVRCMIGFNTMIYDKNHVEKHNNIDSKTSQAQNTDKNYHKNYQAGKYDALRKENKHKNNRGFYE